MPHSNFKERSQAFNTGVGKCLCGKTFDFASEREMKMKLRKGPTGAQGRWLHGVGALVPLHPAQWCTIPCTLSSVLSLQRAAPQHQGPPVAFNKIGVPKKACMMGSLVKPHQAVCNPRPRPMREQQLNECERMRSVHQPWAPTGGP